MASVFTYDPDPPRVSSPWSTSAGATPLLGPADWEIQGGYAEDDAPEPVQLSDYRITKLEAEPQEGPIEYKLHLLLRPRRSFSTSSTGHRVSGSHQSKTRTTLSEYVLGSQSKGASPTPMPSNQSRQNRLQNLTTQLLWRLQQSSPYHSSSKADLVLPTLPEAALGFTTSVRSGKVLAGLEESHGALYEIGVSDDGTFVGITKEEMEESLVNLRSMAASLGCKVQVLRNVIVGDCEWKEESLTANGVCRKAHKENLWVAEALVIPNTCSAQNESNLTSAVSRRGYHSLSEGQSVEAMVEDIESQTAQLRISLTGGTTSGKSSLLGTLTTSTMDNGRGKSRLSLLKHRHEIASGITSSVAPELIGYQFQYPESSGVDDGTRIINYGAGNVSSWTDIHHRAEGGRLVFLADSAGHPRYRRTTVRGLVSWAPHWTICCVAADDDEDPTGRVGATASAEEVLGEASAHIDLSKAHLNFCLKLRLSLVVVVTKFDLASKSGLKQTLTKILSSIKDAGRQPVLLTINTNVNHDLALEKIPISSEETVQKMLQSSISSDITSLVPIVLTSAVTGNGVGTLHALLRHLPIPPSPVAMEGQFKGALTDACALFHIDEVFTKIEQSRVCGSQDSDFVVDSSYVLSGYLRYGRLSVGDEMDIGPFAQDMIGEEGRQLEIHRTGFSSAHLVAESAAGQAERQLHSGDSSHQRASARGSCALPIEGWYRVRILSIRNLRLPVRYLLADQVGTIGIAYCDGSRSPTQRIRKGMVLGHSRRKRHDDNLIAYDRFSASFIDEGVALLPIGSLVTMYVASIRASTKIIGIEGPLVKPYTSRIEPQVVDDVFGFDDSGSDDGGVEIPTEAKAQRCVEMTFQFVTYREWVETGTQVLLMPGGSDRREKYNARLEGYVGRITEAIA
ncbi:hypothetical protein MMC14_001160 [Varicellaria rhodocarpa]|nr:hypothetical protein [Varicellaria rhodocarpa]